MKFRPSTYAYRHTHVILTRQSCRAHGRHSNTDFLALVEGKPFAYMMMSSLRVLLSHRMTLSLVDDFPWIFLFGIKLSYTFQAYITTLISILMYVNETRRNFAFLFTRFPVSIWCSRSAPEAHKTCSIRREKRIFTRKRGISLFFFPPISNFNEVLKIKIEQTINFHESPWDYAVRRRANLDNSNNKLIVVQRWSLPINLQHLLTSAERRTNELGRGSQAVWKKSR